MYMNFWYPVVRSEDLGKTPQKVRILAHDFVVFRDEQGKPAGLSDSCIHRGAPGALVAMSSKDVVPAMDTV